MTQEKMVAYLRENIPRYGLKAVKDDLIGRQGYPSRQVEAACVEALKPAPTLLKRKPALLVEATACLATVAILISVRRPHHPQGAPAAFQAPASVSLPAGPADPKSVDELLARASALDALGRRAEALAALDAAEKLDSTRPEIRRLRERIDAALPPQR